jgi:WD40 repeat protein
MDGKLVILSNDLASIIKEFTLSTNWIQTLSYSPDKKQLAVGAHDCIIYLLETKSYSCKSKFKGHHSFITGIDFSADSSKLQSVSGDYELLFWDCVTGTQLLSATSMRDVKWAKCTCILGWSVQGIWPANADGTDVNSVDRSPDGKYLVTGDDFRKVKLFQYPCPREKTQCKEYKGHSEHVMNVRFSYDGKYVFSVGGLDKSLLQFEVQIPKNK